MAVAAGYACVMLSSRPRMRIPLALVLIAIAGAVCNAAQPAAQSLAPIAPTLAIDGLGKGTVPLDGPWQFHLGDDVAWANPAFDDATGHDGWEQLTADKPWGAQNHFAYAGFAWYRRTLDIAIAPGASPEVAVLVPPINDAYEIYWNGQLVARYGHLPPHPVWYQSSLAQTFGLGEIHRGVMAVRVWQAPFASGSNGRTGGFTSSLILGSPQAIAALKAQADYQWSLSLAGISLYFLYSLLGVLAFGLWLRDRSQTLLLWAAFYFVSIFGEVVFLSGFATLPAHVAYSLGYIFNTSVNIALWYLTIWLLDLRANQRLMRLTRIAAYVVMILQLIDSADLFWVFRTSYELTAQWVDGITTALIIPLSLWNLVPVAVAVVGRRKLHISRWIFACATTFSTSLYMLYQASQQGSRFTHWTLSETLWAPRYYILGAGINFQYTADALVLLSLIYAIYRFSKEGRDRQSALEQEFQNARAVQQVLIPEAIPQVPGFAIDSFYKPAGEVGGDFFQILATPNGGVLAVIGDVSGKGMPAAMTVSLLVGTVRTLAHFTQSPAAILSAMNVRMLGRSQGGFTTCLVLRADADGALTVANAGHIAPYLAGKELALENGLPLGLSAGAAYTESLFQLAPGQQLTLLTDGVVEARDRDGSLFGFERTAAISTETAEKMAQTAQAFGQDDDITVLTLTRVALKEESAMRQTAPMLAPA
jgi:hypothetical protein